MLLVWLAFNLFSGSDDAQPVGEGASIQAPGADLLALSNELSKVTLGQELFSNLSYRRLVDFTVPIPQQALGRPNPFDIIGRD